MNKAKAKKSAGHDDISTFYLKKLSSVVCYPVSKLVNVSIGTGTVPNSMKIAKDIYIFKSKDPIDFTNYRPISLFSALSKILERVIFKRVYKVLTLNNALNTSQYAFRCGHSTVHAITEFVQHVIGAIDGWMNQAYSRRSTTHGHITDWTRLVLVRPAVSLIVLAH